VTQNDVFDFGKYFMGQNKPPTFYHEYFNLKDKVYVPVDDLKIVNKLSLVTKEQVVLHYFTKDKSQNRLFRNIYADKSLHKQFFATTSPDFSVDSNRCWRCFNEANILKARICASRWQTECEESVILTLIWGDKTTYEMAFSNIEKGSVCAVSYQGIQEDFIFREGLKRAIDKIQMDYICWYGLIPPYIKEFYDPYRIIKMQSRNELIKKVKKQDLAKYQPVLEF